MRARIIALSLFLAILAGPAFADAFLPSAGCSPFVGPVAGDQFGEPFLPASPTCGGVVAAYAGPGDVVSGATAWYGLRAYNAAYAASGTGEVVNLRRASDNTTCDFDVATSGALGGSDSGCSLGGGLSLATFATQDATCSGTISSTTLTCSGASSTPHAGSTLTGVGITQPSYIVSCGAFTSGAGTCTLNAAQTVSVGETITMTYGLYVTEAYDQSGANSCSSAPCNVTQATAGNQPELLPTCIGTRPCSLHSGSQWLSGSGGFSSGISVPWAQAVVAERIGAFTSVGSTLTSSGSQSYYFNNATNQAKFQVSSSTSITAAAADSSPHSLIGVANSTSTIVIDGVASTGSTVATSIGGPMVIGSALTSGAAFDLTGYFEEAGYWPGSWNSTQYGNQCHNAYVFYGSTFTTSC